MGARDFGQIRSRPIEQTGGIPAITPRTRVRDWKLLKQLGWRGIVGAMEVGYQVGQVVDRGSIDLQLQWQNHLSSFGRPGDAGFDIYCWGHHYLIDPFQHFQPLPVLARLAAEPGEMKLATSALAASFAEPSRRRRASGDAGPYLPGPAHSWVGTGIPARGVRGLWHPDVGEGNSEFRSSGTDDTPLDRGGGDSRRTLFPRHQCASHGQDVSDSLPTDLVDGDERPGPFEEWVVRDIYCLSGRHSPMT